MESTLRILILEGIQHDADLIEFELKEAGISFTSRHVVTEKEYVKGLQEFSPDVILSDYDPPRYNGGMAFSEARSRCPEVPFILVAGIASEEILAAGARDYGLKNRTQRLASVVQRVLAEAEKHKKQKAIKPALVRKRLDLRYLRPSGRKTRNPPGQTMSCKFPW